MSDIVSEEVTVASIPGGHYREEIARAGAASGVKVLFTSEPTTRLRTIDGCLIVGRFGVTRGTAARTVARLASGGIISRLGQYVRWNGRKLVKTTLWRLRGTTGAALA